jgi:CO/xanthine dehydrogenase Mo-binding subunit
VTRLVACYDIGQAINRQSAERQIEGDAVQGLGHALLEAVALEDGIIRNPHLLDYKIPTTLLYPSELMRLDTSRHRISSAHNPG